MTPCSAACGGSGSRRSSSRSACRRTSSGSSIASSCSRSSLASAADSSNSPSSSWIALSCWRRTNSRWPLSISDWTWDWISEPIEMTSSSRARISTRRRRRRGDVDLLEQPLLLLGFEAQRAGDEVAERAGVVDVGDRELQLLGQVGTLSTIAENVCWTLRVSASSSADSLGRRRAARRSRPPGRASRAPSSSMRTRWPPWTRMRSVPSGTLIMRAMAPTTPTS